MDTPIRTSPSLLDRIRSHRLATTFALLATLSVGILVGSVLTHGVSGKEQAPVDSSDARPLVIPSPVTLSNGFSQIVKQVGPAVVNINTDSLPKQSATKHRAAAASAHPRAAADDDDQQQPRATCRTSSTASSAARAATATMTAASAAQARGSRLRLHRRSSRLHHHQQPRRR